eukprot:12344765-Karenia_brevis.AAC.1
MSNIAFLHAITIHEICDVQIMLWQRVHAAAHELQQNRYNRSKQKTAKAVKSRKLGFMFKKLKPFAPSPVAMKDSS